MWLWLSILPFMWKTVRRVDLQIKLQILTELGVSALQGQVQLPATPVVLFVLVTMVISESNTPSQFLQPRRLTSMCSLRYFAHNSWRRIDWMHLCGRLLQTRPKFSMHKLPCGWLVFKQSNNWNPAWVLEACNELAGQPDNYILQLQCWKSFTTGTGGSKSIVSWFVR